MSEQAAAKKAEADRLVSQSFFRSSPVFRSFQTESSIQSSFESLQQALTLYRDSEVRAVFPQESRKGEADALFNFHFSHRALGQHGEAIADLQQAIAIYQDIQAHDSTAKSVETLGLLYTDLQQYPQAIQYLTQACGLYRMTDPDQECNVLNHLGVTCLMADQIEEAAYHYQEAIKVAQGIGSLDRQLMPLRNLASIYSKQNDYLQARECGEQALTLARQLGDLREQFKSLYTLGELHYTHNQLALSVDCLQQALNVMRESGSDLSLEPVLLADLSKSYAGLGNYSEAINYLQQAIAIAQQTGNHQAQLDCSFFLADTYYAATQYPEAIALYQQLLNVAQTQGDLQMEAGLLISLGACYLQLNQLTLACECYQKARPMYESLGNLRGEANCWHNLGQCYAMLKQYNAVLNCIQQALNCYRKLDDRPLQIRCLGDIAATYFSLEQPQNAIAPLEQELTMVQQMGAQPAEIDVLTRLAMAYLGVGQSSRCLQLLQQAVDISRAMGDQEAEFKLQQLIATFRGL
jgi:tetratricopeptide (TPR) repeat protein